MMYKQPGALSSPAPPDKVVTVHTLVREPESTRVKYAGVRSKGIGWLLIIGGCASVLLGGLLLWACSLAGVTGAGLWGGGFYIIAGALGVCAGNNKSKSYITGFLVTCVLAMIIGFGVIASTAVALAISDSTGTYYCQSYSSFDTRGTVMECILLIVAILLFFLLIWAVNITSRIICCGKITMEQPRSAAEVKYSEPQDMILTSSRPTSPLQKSAGTPASANVSRDHFQFPPAKDMHYSHDTSQQYNISQYSGPDYSYNHQTSQYSGGGAGGVAPGPPYSSSQPYNPNAPNTPQYSAAPSMGKQPHYPANNNPMQQQRPMSQNSQYSNQQTPQYNTQQPQYAPQQYHQSQQQYESDQGQGQGHGEGRSKRPKKSQSSEQNFY